MVNRMSNDREIYGGISAGFDELPAWVAAIAAASALLAYAVWLAWVRDRTQTSS